MIKNYFKIAWRNLFRNRVSSFINITGLSVGMAVAMLIGLWIWNELSFDKYHQNYRRIAQVMENDTHNGTIHTNSAIPLPLDAEMRKSYGSDFKHIVMASWNDQHVLAVGNKKISYPGSFIGEEAPEMLTLDMIKGSRNGLKDPSSMIISKSVAIALFGDADPMNKVVMLDNKASFTVSGVYNDLPLNTSLQEIAFMAPWNFFAANKDWIGRDPDNWGDNSLFMYVQLAGYADLAKVSEKIKNIKLNKISAAEARTKPEIFLQPMSKWHLFSTFKNGINTGGAVQYVWLFGIIGMFVLLLACINFMNLSTARSEKRAKEVGIRKAVGSLRKQLVGQFFCESLLIAVIAFIFSLFLVWMAIPFFNEVASKRMTILWNNPLFWMISICFTLFTGLIAGSYPAIYLSSFNPVKVLKGGFKAGRFASVPRKALVVLQFTISVILIIGTIVVFKQIHFAKNRPIGYNRDGLIAIETTNDDLNNNFYSLRTDLLKSGAVTETAESSSPTTAVNNDRGDLNWKDKDPSLSANFGNIVVTSEYGKTVGWQFTDGRDFSSLFTDSSSVILNVAAAKFIGFKNPVGEIIRVGKRDLTVIGVIKDMVMSSPYEPVKQTIFRIGHGHFDNILIKINANSSAHDALNKIAAVCKVYSPSVPFFCKFADDEYAKKFTLEERVGKLADVFASLAIFISCLGLFGMASFMAEQRVKEIGVRKVLGASVFKLWRLLSKDFVILVILSLVVAVPSAWYFMHSWLQNYQYRTEISWWIFAATGAGAIVITLLTVSFQSVKAALANPVKSLRTE
jgi:putative ABC transport system permease protein